MASDSFTRADENPMASPWVGFGGGWNNLKLISNAVAAAVGGGSDCGMRYTGSNGNFSRCVVTTVGGRDGGPAINLDGSGNGYVVTNYDNANFYLFRIDNTSFVQIGTIGGTYSNGDVLELERVSGNVIFRQNSVDKITAASSTYTGGLSGLFAYDDTIRLDDWTDGAAAATPSDALFRRIRRQQHLLVR